MDRRLALEFLPGIAFLAGNAYGGLFWAAGATVVATALAVALRLHWDREIPWLAVATLVLAAILTVIGFALNDATFILIRPTVGAVAFAAILACGALARPSLLRRALGYRLRISEFGWRTLHIAWIALALLSGVGNEIARRVLTTDQWAIFNVASDPALFILIWLATRSIAERYWIDEPHS
ncbi:MAG: septation protein IspZ [Pseudomonadota bacterium]